MQFAVIMFSIPFILRILMYIYHLVLVNNFLNENETYENTEVNKNVLILIPVLREQNVIRNTIDHFMKMKVDGINLNLVIAATNREKKSEKESTIEVVESWINEYKSSLPENIDVDYCEAADEGGDRATQLNYAVSYVKKTKNISKLDFIGVYDADSLPSERTLQEVAFSFNDKNLGACQQPVHFAESANRMSENRENPVLIANALYQSTWTAISELPMWIKYYRSVKSKRHLYLIGHGEFITEKIYNEFHFPEYEITDGIQLGYRLGMSGVKVKPLHEFCNDDVPHKISSVINQHKRWFGGCMNFKSSYSWSKNKYHTNAWTQVIDGLWSQARWAWTALFYIILLICSLFMFKQWFYVLLCIGIIYCYIIPVIAHKVMKVKVKVKLRDWICLPLAIGLKSIGPNIYIINKFLGKKVKYEKVER